MSDCCTEAQAPSGPVLNRDWVRSDGGLRVWQDSAISRDQTAAKRPWRPGVLREESRMPEPGLFGAVSTGIFVFGGIVVAIVVSVFAIVIVRGLRQWRRNNASPVVTTLA
jgi:hypothetical protein